MSVGSVYPIDIDFVLALVAIELCVRWAPLDANEAAAGCAKCSLSRCRNMYLSFQTESVRAPGRQGECSTPSGASHPRQPQWTSRARTFLTAGVFILLCVVGNLLRIGKRCESALSLYEKSCRAV